MKKHCSYRQTATGIRIPKRKIKWMSPKKDSTPTDLDIIIPGSKQFSNLYHSNFTFLIQREALSESGEVIDATDCQEGEQDGH